MAAEKAKETKNFGLRNRGDDFRPFSLETLGTFGRSALGVVEAIAHRLWVQIGGPLSRSLNVCHIAAAVQSANGVAILEVHGSSRGGHSIK